MSSVLRLMPRRVYSTFRTTSDVAVLIVAGMMPVDILTKVWWTHRLIPSITHGFSGNMEGPATILFSSLRDTVIATDRICINAVWMIHRIVLDAVA